MGTPTAFLAGYFLGIGLSSLIERLIFKRWPWESGK